MQHRERNEGGHTFSPLRPPPCWFFIHAHFKGQEAGPFAIDVLVDGPGLLGPERERQGGEGPGGRT